MSHKHVLVDGKKVNIPSFQVKVGQAISLDSKAAEIPATKKLLQGDLKLPGWLISKGPIGSVKREPKTDDVAEPISTQDIVEFYSR